MKQNDQFVNRKIGDRIYILPIGQKAAGMVKGLSLNETGVFLWTALKENISEQKLVSICREHFGIGEDGTAMIEKDVSLFLKALRDRGMLEGSKGIYGCSCSYCSDIVPMDRRSCFDNPDGTIAEGTDDISHYTDIEIGGLGISLYGDASYFLSDFDSFKTLKLPEKSMRIEVVPVEPEDISEGYYDEEDTKDSADTDDRYTSFYEPEEETGNVLIHQQDLTVLEFSGKYVLIFPKATRIYEVHLKKDGSLARIYCEQGDKVKNQDIFWVIRMVFLVFALYNGLVMVHSASILFKDKAWLFSGASGSGKSTQSQLWKKVYDVPVINGDLNLVGMKDGKPVIYGTPWCGSSGVFDNKMYPLGGIILLRRGNNTIQELTYDQKVLYVQQRIISPTWTEDMFDKGLKVVEDIVPGTYIKRYYCNKEDESAVCIHDDIEKSL